MRNISLPSPGKYLETSRQLWFYRILACFLAESTKIGFCKLYAAVPALLDTSPALSFLIRGMETLLTQLDQPFSLTKSKGKLREIKPRERKRKEKRESKISTFLRLFRFKLQRDTSKAKENITNELYTL